MHRRPRTRFALILALGAAPLLGTACGEPSPTEVPEPERGADLVASSAEGAQRAPLRPLFRGLQLTDAQKAEIRAIGEAHRPDIAAARERMEALREEWIEARRAGDSERVEPLREKAKPLREEIRELRARMLAEVRDVLAPEQQTRLDQNLARLRERFRRAIRGRQPHPGARGGRTP